MDPELRRASTSGVLWNLAQNLAGRIASLVVVAVLGRILDRSAFGVVALAATFTAVAELLTAQGLTEFIVQRKELRPEDTDTVFWTNVGIAAVLAAALAAAAEPASAYFDDPELAPIVRWMALAVLIRSTAIVPTGLLVRELRFRAISVRTVLASVIGGSVGIVTALAGWGPMALVAQVLVGDLLGAGTLWFACSWRPRLRYSLLNAREAIAFGAPTLAASLLLVASRRFDSMAIADALGTAMLGVYAVAQRVFQVISQITNKSIDSVALSAFSKLAGQDETRREAVMAAGELASAIAVPAYFGLMVVAAPAIEVLLGPRWSDAAPALTLLAVAGIPQTTGYIHAAALKAAGSTRSVLVIHVLITIIFLPAVAAVVGFGVAAVAGAYAATLILVWPLQLHLLKRTIGLSPLAYAARIARPTAAAAVMAGALWLVSTSVKAVANPPAWLQLLVFVPLGAGVYIGALRVLAPAVYSRGASTLARRLRRGTAAE